MSTMCTIFLCYIKFSDILSILTTTKKQSYYPYRANHALRRFGPNMRKKSDDIGIGARRTFLMNGRRSNCTPLTGPLFITNFGKGRRF